MARRRRWRHPRYSVTRFTPFSLADGSDVSRGDGEHAGDLLPAGSSKCGYRPATVDAEGHGASADRSAASGEPDDALLVAALRAGDEAAFGELVDRYYGVMQRVARQYVATKEAAEDVVQETFLGVIQGIGRFEGRSSLRTWMFRILVNRARTRGEREGRTRPFSSLSLGLDHDEPAVDPDRFASEGRWAGCWSSPPPAEELPESSVLAAELGSELRVVIDSLPAAQRTVLELRDVQGMTSAEVCDLLELSEANQRVLLHRARSKARAALERSLPTLSGVGR
jgi:RNA polymerase sigma-70 factor, ECF subfamily